MVVNNELGARVYRKLLYYFENKIPIHFSLIDNGWKNGTIVELKKGDWILILDELKEGRLSFLLEDIEINSISSYREKAK